MQYRSKWAWSIWADSLSVTHQQMAANQNSAHSPFSVELGTNILARECINYMKLWLIHCHSSWRRAPIPRWPTLSEQIPDPNREQPSFTQPNEAKPVFESRDSATLSNLAAMLNTPIHPQVSPPHPPSTSLCVPPNWAEHAAELANKYRVPHVRSTPINLTQQPPSGGRAVLS